MSRIRGTQKALETLSRLDQWVVRHPEEFRGRWKEDFFHNDHPIHLELGMGRGGFLTALAQRDSHINFIGMERFTPVLAQAARNLEKAQVHHVALLHQDVSRLPFFFAPEEIERIYLNFVDPWPKKKHAKRRLTHTYYLQLYKQVLRKGGSIVLKTDNESLFAFSLNELSANRFRLQGITFHLHESCFASDNVLTEYEQRFVQQGKQIYRCEAVWEGE